MHGNVASFSSVDPRAPVRVVIVTLDNHLKKVRSIAPMQRWRPKASNSACMPLPNGGSDPVELEKVKAAIAEADIVIATMLFLDDHIRMILPELEARREDCDAMVCLMSAGEVVRLTKMGAYRMDAPAKGPLALLKKLRGSSGKGWQAQFGRWPDEDAAPPAEDPEVHPRHRAGRARLFPDLAILAGRVGRECRRDGTRADRSLCRRRADVSPRHHQGRSADRISRNRGSIIRAPSNAFPKACACFRAAKGVRARSV